MRQSAVLALFLHYPKQSLYIIKVWSTPWSTRSPFANGGNVQSISSSRREHCHLLTSPEGLTWSLIISLSKCYAVTLNCRWGIFYQSDLLLWTIITTSLLFYILVVKSFGYINFNYCIKHSISAVKHNLFRARRKIFFFKYSSIVFNLVFLLLFVKYVVQYERIMYVIGLYLIIKIFLVLFSTANTHMHTTRSKAVITCWNGWRSIFRRVMFPNE